MGYGGHRNDIDLRNGEYDSGEGEESGNLTNTHEPSKMKRGCWL